MCGESKLYKRKIWRSKYVKVQATAYTSVHEREVVFTKRKPT
jgi:hypothetical protein